MRKELRIPRDAALATNAEEIDVNEDEKDKEMEVDEDLSPPTSRDEEVHEQRRPKSIRYDPKCDHKKIQVQLSMRFVSHTQFKRAMWKYVITKGIDW